jgi:pyruvate dehydrogenase phosphatase
MLRRAWKPVAGTVVVGAPAYYYYKTYYSAPQTFELPVRIKGPSGKAEMSTKTIKLLPMSELNARILENATFETQARPDGFRWRYTTANLPSNDPIEDAHASHIVARDDTDPSAPGDYLFFAVMDGHGGFETSRLLSRVLIQAVALELSNLIKDPKATAQPGLLDRLRSAVWSSSSSPVKAPFDADPKKVSNAIEQAFVGLDKELLETPLRILANNMDEAAWKNKTIPDLSQHPLALPTMLPAISGTRIHVYLTATSLIQLIQEAAPY